MSKEMIIYGAGGHGKVIADIIEKSGGTIYGFIDDSKRGKESIFYHYPILGGLSELVELHHQQSNRFSVIIALGNNSARQDVALQLKSAGICFGTAIHPSAQLARGVTIGEGTVIMANSVINSDAVIGRFCIINTAATVDHDACIGDYVHLSPGVHLGGTVTIEASSWLGVGAAVINNIHIGQDVTVGAGSVVIRPIASHCVVVGNPARLLRKIVPEDILI